MLACRKFKRFHGWLSLLYRWLEAHHLRACKGAPETFDVDKLAENLRLVRAGEATWPQYDRQRHDPVEQRCCGHRRRS
ncbi:nucleoside triphosphate hydrolase domain-containing protein [Salmonella enterica subsp. enterica]|uniref:Nucleoside triphosphate hydrolase domain-containing protein n=1 Tax=Salmonella enterica I TaxID=59201 RepID=A0A447N480_SALET|nr:nucleoside triphosphate hydrolase domain-containing protein [Salmonella enterica subsp. enterica]